MRFSSFGLAGAAMFLLGGCGGDDTAPPGAPGYAVSGAVSGLDGALSLALNAGAPLAIEADGRFTFAGRLADGAHYEVTVASQPAGQACAVANGEGDVAGADVTDVAVSCATDALTLGGKVTGVPGAGVKLRETVGGQTIDVAAGAAGYAFAQPFVEGAAYAITVESSPGLACTVAHAAGTMTADVDDADLACAPLFGDLVLSEVGSTFFFDAPAWVELYNGTSSDIALADYQLRVRGVNRSDLTWAGGPGAATTFALPAATVPKGGYLVVAGKAFQDLHDSAQGIFVLSGPSTVPFWDSAGSIELVKSDATIDYVRFGGPGAAPVTPSAWSGAVAPALPNATESDYGKALARDLGAVDSNTAADWKSRGFATPGGPNDVTSDADDDGDGLPDSAEEPGGTYAGLPLHDWGARKGDRDIFIEIDRMDPKGFDGTLDEGMRPRREALEKVAAVFAGHGIRLHFDAGDLFDAAAGIDPADHDLGGGGEVPFACALDIGFGQPPQGGAQSLAKLKAASFDLRRKPVFHYAVFANNLGDAACGESGSSGVAEAPGNDLIVALGRWGLEASSAEAKNLLINYQAAAFMHEFGHNLGLFHGGGEDANYKPNYLSVMNYLYFDGLPEIGNSEGDRYYWYHGYYCGSHGVDELSQLTHPPSGDPAAFRLDYSDGSSGDLVKSSLDEGQGLLREGSGPVDYNWDFAFGSSVSARVDAEEGFGPCKVKSSGSGESTDHDDWANLVLPFSRFYWGEGSGAPPAAKSRAVPDMMGDRQPVTRETPRPAWQMAQMRALIAARRGKKR